MRPRLNVHRLIGGLLVLYRLVLAITGAVAIEFLEHNGVGIHVDMWTGLGMLIVAGAMVAWARWAPIERGEVAETVSSHTARRNGSRELGARAMAPDAAAHTMIEQRTTLARPGPLPQRASYQNGRRSEQRLLHATARDGAHPEDDQLR